MRKAWIPAVLVVLGWFLVPGTPRVRGQASEPQVPRAVIARLERHRVKEFVPGELIVKKKLVAGIARMVPTDRVRAMGVDTQPRAVSGGAFIYKLAAPPTGGTRVLRAAAGDSTLAAVRAFKARPEVEYAQPNYLVHATADPNDTQYPLQWHYRPRGTGPGQVAGGINLPQVWDTNTGRASVVVAVIDTGILPNHPDILGSPNLGTGFDLISDPARSNDGDGRDADSTDTGDALAVDECGPGDPLVPEPSSWHGTHVAGTIGVGRTGNAAGVAGINWNVTVLPVRVLGKCGGETSDINDAIRWAAGLPVPGMPPNPTKARVINMSLGGPAACSESPSTQGAIDDAVAAGATVVVAAGNDAMDAAGSFPASCRNVISVAASDRRGFLSTRYSNFGRSVTIMAPGGDVDRDDDADGRPDGVLSMVDGGYAFYNGTSMAAPHVAGVIALWLAQDPGLTREQILTRLKDTALARSTTECPRPCGAGLLDASGVQGLVGGPSPTPAPSPDRPRVPDLSWHGALLLAAAVAFLAFRRARAAS